MDPLITVALLALLTGVMYLAMWRAGHTPRRRAKIPRDRRRDWRVIWFIGWILPL